jgi:hypothetical protein
MPDFSVKALKFCKVILETGNRCLRLFSVADNIAQRWANTVQEVNGL